MHFKCSIYYFTSTILSSFDDTRYNMRKPVFMYENNSADEMSGNRIADQHVCFHCIDCIIPLPHKSESSSLLLSSVAVRHTALNLCLTKTEIMTPGFHEPYHMETCFLHYAKTTEHIRCTVTAFVFDF